MVFWLLISVLCLLWLLTRPFYWVGKGIKFAYPLPFVGNFGETLRGGLVQLGRSLYQKFPDERLYGIHVFSKPGLLIRDPELINNICVRDFDHFTSNSLGSNQEYDSMGGNLLFLHGSQWKEVRSKLSPFFTPAKVKHMLSNVEKSISKATKVLDESSRTGDPCDLGVLLGQITNDVITQSLFGIESDVFEEKSFFKNLAALFFSTKATMMFSLRNVSQTLFKYLRLQSFDLDSFLFLKKIMKEIVEQRREKNMKGADFVQGIIEIMENHKLEGNQEELKYYPDGTRVPKFTFDEMFLQAFIIFMGGVESSATTMTWLFYELVQNQESQDRCRDEILAVVKKNKRSVTLDDINDVPYNLAAINEAVRMYPAFAILSRICTKPIYMSECDLNIEKGTLIMYPTEAVQRDSQYFPDPNTFNPDRFLDGCPPISGVQTTFGLGPRLCLGKSFAIHEILLVVSSLLERYKFEINEKTKVPLERAKTRPINSPSTPLWVNVIPI
ncbi:cytochrome P450 [Nesidiocoris tenuis]|uniref:Cytochrome P450 n=1 Tax=Nesidiocoris tenuis TaxID=355587 RepID=A0ABN7AR15_9HEMI|nr:cytochrome P450 [Nesidiocoris tenuis]